MPTVSSNGALTEIFLTSYEEHLTFEFDPDYIAIDGAEDYLVIAGVDGDDIPVSAITTTGFLGVRDEYVSLGADGEAVGTQSATIDVVEGAITVDVATIGDVTNISNVFNGVGLNIEYLSAAPVSALQFSTVYACDTSGGTFSITPPTPTADGDWLGVWDAGGNFALENLIIRRDGRTFQGFPTDLLMNCSNAGVFIVARGTDWDVFATTRFGAEEFLGKGGNGVYIQQDQPPNGEAPWVWYELDVGGNLANIKIGLA